MGRRVPAGEVEEDKDTSYRAGASYLEMVRLINKLTLTSINYFRVTFEPVTFARCAFIIALRNIALDGYLDTHRNI